MPDIIVGVNHVDLFYVEETGLYSRRIQADDGDIIQVTDFALPYGPNEPATAKVVVIHPLTEEEAREFDAAEESAEAGAPADDGEGLGEASPAS